jgi:hypothetical protein
MGWDGVLLWPEAPVNPCGLPPGRLRLAALFLPHLRLFRSLPFDRELGLFGWLVADGWCWFVLREEYCWLVAAGCWWLIRSERKVLLASG